MPIDIPPGLFRRLALGAILTLTFGRAQTDDSAQPAPVSPASALSTLNTSLGSSSAPITILVFSDFESFPCARSASVIDGLLQQTRDVRVIFKHAPAAQSQRVARA